MYRQGSVALRPIATIPRRARPVPRKRGPLRLAAERSPAIASSRATLFRDDARGTLFVKISGTRSAELHHEAHAPVAVPPGNYEVVTDQEYRSSGISRRELAEDVPLDAAGLQGPREERIELRATKEEKRILVAAAAYRHMDLTSFIMQASLPAAREVVHELDRWRISVEDATLILDLLETPPEPNRFVRQAWAKSRRL